MAAAASSSSTTPPSSPFLNVARDDRDITPTSNFLPPDPQVINNIPRIPSHIFRPKQSLGQNFLVDPNTAKRIVSTFYDLVVGEGSSPAAAAEVAGASSSSSSSSSSVLPPSPPLHYHIIEVGPGAGALTELLRSFFPFPKQLSLIEIDDRAVSLLKDRFPQNSVNIIHRDVLQVDYADFATAVWSKHASGSLPLPAGSAFGGVCLVGNLPYYLTSQILFSLLDSSHVSPSSGSLGRPSVLSATVTMQKEVGERLVALPRTKAYGILSVIFQLYATPKMMFGLPPNVFYPVPKVDSTLVYIKFKDPRELRETVFKGVKPEHLRKLTKRVFEGRRKTLRNTIGRLLEELQENRGDGDDDDDDDKDENENENENDETDDSHEEEKASTVSSSSSFASRRRLAKKSASSSSASPSRPACSASQLLRRSAATVFSARPEGLPDNWPDKRPEELLPREFVELTRLVFGDVHGGLVWDDDIEGGRQFGGTKDNYDLGKRVWRKRKHSRS